MSYPVTYYCPRCEALAELEREGYLADKTVTPYPLAGWEYATPDEPFEDADGVAFTCGADDTLVDGETGCGEPFYLSFVRYEGGRRVEGDRGVDAETVELAGEGPRGPPGPDAFRG